MKENKGKNNIRMKKNVQIKRQFYTQQTKNLDNHLLPNITIPRLQHMQKHHKIVNNRQKP